MFRELLLQNPWITISLWAFLRCTAGLLSWLSEVFYNRRSGKRAGAQETMTSPESRGRRGVWVWALWGSFAVSSLAGCIAIAVAWRLIKGSQYGYLLDFVVGAFLVTQLVRNLQFGERAVFYWCRLKINTPSQSSEVPTWYNWLIGGLEDLIYAVFLFCLAMLADLRFFLGAACWLCWMGAAGIRGAVEMKER